MKLVITMRDDGIIDFDKDTFIVKKINNGTKM